MYLPYPRRMMIPPPKKNSFALLHPDQLQPSVWILHLQRQPNTEHLREPLVNAQWGAANCNSSGNTQPSHYNEGCCRKIAPVEFAPNERLQSRNELAKQSFSFTELAPMRSARRQGSHIRHTECVHMWVDIIYLSFFKKHRLIIALTEANPLRLCAHQSERGRKGAKCAQSGCQWPA